MLEIKTGNMLSQRTIYKKVFGTALDTDRVRSEYGGGRTSHAPLRGTQGPGLLPIGSI